MARKKGRPTAAGRVARALLIDFVCIGLGLCLFALFHHVLPMWYGIQLFGTERASEVDPTLAEHLSGFKLDAVVTQAPAETPAPEETPVPAVTPEPTAAPEPAATAEPAATPEPEPTPEPAAAPEPEITPEPEATEAPGQAEGLAAIPAETTVNEASPAGQIAAVQARLIELGWLEAAEPSGVYDTDTRYAVAYFQSAVNNNNPIASLKKDGWADPETLEWLAASWAPANPDSEVAKQPGQVMGERIVGGPGDFSELFDSLGLETNQVYADGGKYLSDDVYIRITKDQAPGVRFYVADIYVRNVKNLRTAVASELDPRVRVAFVWDMAKEVDAILSVSGDYYSARNDGVMVRNGKLYRDTFFGDVCVIYNDGEMVTCAPAEFDLTAARERGIWQAWSFGPALLDSEGHAKTAFDSAVVRKNPRCGIGYFEPGHYCFVVVDGRAAESGGMSLAEFSLLFEQLGCECAYNLDGGNTAAMVYRGSCVNEPSQGGRKLSDIIYIGEVLDK